jgi:flavin reductase (DIM6/NTAB) family NADH-FMN oxidoreductase RutF
MKQEIPIRPFWYSDAWIFPKLVTVVTTLDAEGRVNAAPYSHIMQFDVMHKRPRIMLGFRQDSHTFNNIAATGEFVINCPSADYIDDIMESARFYPEGVSELDHTRFTTIPSRKVKPPSIEQAPQIMECTVDEIVRLPQSSGIVYANIVSIVMDEGLEQMDRSDRIAAMNLPIGLGDQDRMEYYFARTTDVVHQTLKETPRGHLAAKIATTLEWDEQAMQGLMQIPPPVRPMVTEQVETHAKSKGATTVTLTHMDELMAEFGMDRAVMARFETKGTGGAAGADAPPGEPAVTGVDREPSKKEQSILDDANAIDPDVTFTLDAAAELTGVPRPFVKKAIKGIVRRAKEEGVQVVDAAFVQHANAARKG